MQLSPIQWTSGSSIGCGHCSPLRDPCHLPHPRQMIFCQYSLLAYLSPVSLVLWSSLFTILITFSPLLLMSMTITSSPAFLVRSVLSFIVRPLPLWTTIHTLIPFSMSYATWLILHPARALGGSARNTASAFHSIPIFSAAMAHRYDLAQLCLIALNILGSNSSSVSRLSAGRHDHRSSCCRSCWHSCCCWVVLSTIVMSSASIPPSLASAISSSVLPLSSPSGALAHRMSAVLFVCEVGSAVFVVRSAGSVPLSRASLVASAFFAYLLLNVMWFPFAVRALLWCVAAERALHCNVPHDVVCMGACVVRARAAAPCRFAAALALYGAPSAAMITSAVRAYICAWFDSVPHSPRCDAFIGQSARHLDPLYHKHNERCGDLPPLSHSPNAVRVW